MPKAITKSKNNNPHKPKFSFDITLDAFIETGHFTLTNEIVTTELLIYFINYLNLNKPSNPSSKLNYKFYLDNVTFNVGASMLSSQGGLREAAVEVFLDQIFSFSPKWSVIALDNVSILQGNNYYPLSSAFIWRFINQIAVKKSNKAEFIVTNALIITKAELHTWTWMKAFTSPLRLDSLTLELLPHEDNEDNFLVLCEALQYAKIKILNLGETEINLQGYHALNELLDKNYFIEKMLIKEPTDPESRAIFKKINERLPENRTGKQRFDIEKFNQAEFLRFILNAQNALQHETDDREISKLKREIEFILEEKWLFSISITNRENWLKLAPGFHAVYFDHAEYILGRLPLFRLDLNRLIDNETRTLGHSLLENALERNDTFMVRRLINAEANLLEQRDDEKPLLIQIFEKNTDFKLLILNHIFHDRTLVSTAERVLQNYSKPKEIIVNMGFALINYAEILTKRACPYLLSDSERLLNLLKNVFRLSRPSKQRDKEFIEIYYRLFKLLILFHNAGRITVESISNAQRLLAEIGTISLNADWGWKGESQLHSGIRNRLGSLKENMKEIEQLAEKDDMIYEKDKVIAQQAATIKDMTEKSTNLEAKIQQAQAQIVRLKAALKTVAVSEDNEVSTLNEAGPSSGFFPKH